MLGKLWRRTLQKKNIEKDKEELLMVSTDVLWTIVDTIPGESGRDLWIRLQNKLTANNTAKASPVRTTAKNYNTQK